MTQYFAPALRGFIGDWVYYVCLLPMQEIAHRVSFADTLHPRKELSNLVQRELRKGRAVEIARYLKTQRQRFFNSLVVAVYEGDPSWYSLSDISPRAKEMKGGAVPRDVIHSVGFLSFTGEEQMFAVDGQHRLAGIKQAVTESKEIKEECTPVVLVGHRNSPDGIVRTRRLFTTLNKTARPVSKAEIIALDEDDVAAILARRLSEEHPYFARDRLLFTHTNNLPVSNDTSMTTIGNLYDVLHILMGRTPAGPQGDDPFRYRPTDRVLAKCHENACRFFALLDQHFPALQSYFASSNYASVVRANRHKKGGHVMFRPVGLRVFTEVIADLAQEHSLSASVRLSSKLPTELSRAPFERVLWDPKRSRILSSGASLVRRLLLYQLGRAQSSDRLARDYAKALGEAGNGKKQLQRLRKM